MRRDTSSIYLGRLTDLPEKRAVLIVDEPENQRPSEAPVRLCERLEDNFYGEGRIQLAVAKPQLRLERYHRPGHEIAEDDTPAALGLTPSIGARAPIPAGHGLLIRL